MNIPSGVRGVLLAAIAPLMMWSAGTARGQYPNNYGAYPATPRPVAPEMAGSMEPGTAPPGFAPGAMYDPRMPSRPYGHDDLPPPMNGSAVMPAGGPGMQAPTFPPMPSPLPSGPMPGPMTGQMPGPMLNSPSPTGPMPTLNGAMPGMTAPSGPVMSEPPYSTFPASGYPAGGCASGTCGAGGCGPRGCGPRGCGTGGCGAGGCGAGGCGTEMCGTGCYSPASIFENFVVFGGFDGARAPEDLGINANVGGRVGVATVLGLEELGIGLELGTAVNYHATATAFQRDSGGPGRRTQHFATIGIFQRTCSGFLWGVAYDYVHTDSYADIHATQWRGQIGWKVDPCNEFGIWGTHRDRGDGAVFAGDAFHLHGIDMANFYYTRYWSCAVTRLWVGVAERHGRAILNSFPDPGPIDHTLVYGADFLVPLSPCVSIFAQANLITPYDTGIVTAFVGLAVYPASTANVIPRSRFAPMFGVANNTNFAMDARR